VGVDDRRDLTRPTDAGADAARRSGAVFWVALVVGWAIIGYGVRGVLMDAGSVRPFQWATWIVAADVVHDLVVAPLVCGIGVVLARLVPGRGRAPLQAGFIASGVVLAFAWIPWRGYGRRPDDPSALPLDYTTATLTVLAMVWALVGLWLLIVAVSRARPSQ